MTVLSFARQQPMAFLRTVLRVNAVFSTLSGLVMIVGGRALGAWLGRPGTTTPDGIVLGVFALLLVYLTRRPEVSLKAATVVVALDVLWVLDVGRQIFAGQLTTAGAWALGIVALVVLELAVLQAVGIRLSSRLQKAPVAAT